MIYAALAAFAGFPMCYTAKRILALINPEETPAIVQFKYGIVWFSFAVSRISFYIFMVLRIHYLFQHTSLALTKNSRIIHGIIIILSPFWIVVMVILQSFDDPVFQMWYQAISIGLIVVLMLGSIHLLYLFNRSLFQLLKQDKLKHRGRGNRVKSVSATNTEQSSTETQSTTVSTKTRVTRKEINVNRRSDPNHTLLNTIVKHNFLTWIIISMFLCFVVMFGLLSFGMEWTDTQKYTLWWIQCLTINIATFCIFLGFNINNMWYDVICGKCDICCGSIFRRRVEGQLQRYMEENEKEEQQKQIEMSAADQTPVSYKGNGSESPVTVSNADEFGGTEIGRKVSNLVDNAFEIGMDDGNETIQVESIDLDIAVDTVKDGGNKHIEVDTIDLDIAVQKSKGNDPSIEMYD